MIMSLTRSNELLGRESTQLSLPGSVKRASGRIADAAIEIGDFILLAPIFVPDLDEVRSFADRVHTKGLPWRGVAFGSRANYEPESASVPAGSKAKFTPASFCLGDANAWCYCLTWEDGIAEEPDRDRHG